MGWDVSYFITSLDVFHKLVREKRWNSEMIAEKHQEQVILMKVFVGKAFHYSCSKCAKGQSNK